MKRPSARRRPAIRAAGLTAELSRVTKRGEAAEGGLMILATLSDEASLQAMEEALGSGPRSRGAVQAARVARAAAALFARAARSGRFRRWAGTRAAGEGSMTELRRKARALSAHLRERGLLR